MCALFSDGTTDVTRTFHFGTPTSFEKEAYTRVLMGAIDLACAVWANGTYGMQSALPHFTLSVRFESECAKTLNMVYQG